MKRIFFIILTGVFVFQINAQINEPGKFYVTPKVGYNMANITLLDKYGADPRHGINAGIAFGYAINEMISIEPGVFYSMQGSAFKIGKVKFGLNNDYLAVPVFFKAYLIEGLHLYAGPQFSYLLSSQFKVKTGLRFLDDVINIVSKNLDLSKYENKFDVSLAVGLGYQFANGFNISANYNFGVSKVPKFEDFKWGNETFSLDINAKNSLLQLNIGYRF